MSAVGFHSQGSARAANRGRYPAAATAGFIDVERNDRGRILPGNSNGGDTMTTISAEPDFVVVIPLIDRNGIAGFVERPLVAWRVDGNADHGLRVPIMENDDEPFAGLYVVQTPDGSYHFSDGERCENADAVVAGFRKRFVR
jgi:hypothetical protein